MSMGDFPHFLISSPILIIKDLKFLSYMFSHTFTFLSLPIYLYIVKLLIFKINLISNHFPEDVYQFYLELQVLYWMYMESMDNLVLFLILMKFLWASLHLICCLLFACCTLTLLCLSMFPVSLILYPRLSSWRGVEFHQRHFQHLVRWSCSFFLLSFCLYGELHWQIFICWTIPASVEWRQLDYGGWSFWCVLRFSFLLFYYIFCIDVVILFLCWVFVWFD